MRYLVQYVGEGGSTFAKAFKAEEPAKAFAESLGKAFLDFFSETIVSEAEEFTVYRQVENLRYKLK